MVITIIPSGQAYSELVTRLDLTQPLDIQTLTAIKLTWLVHHVLSSLQQAMVEDGLESFSQYMGPFILLAEDRSHNIAEERPANETSSLVAEGWHKVWIFQENLPVGTCLFGITIAPHNGDMLCINQHKALVKMPAELRTKIEGELAMHSAVTKHSPQGLCVAANKEKDRNMTLVPLEEAKERSLHPLLRIHPESDKEAVYKCVGYIVGIDGMEEATSKDLLVELYQWQKDMLMIWGVPSVLNPAISCYEGYDRSLHRTAIGSVG